MSHPMQFLARNTRGGVIIEFALSTLLTVTVLLSTIEFGLEMFARQSSEYAANVAGTEYALRRSVSETEEAVMDALPLMMRRCVEPLEVRVFDTVAGVDLVDQGAGRAASADHSATVARIIFVCRWNRLTPVARLAFGPVFEHRAVVYTRMRD